ncbi:ubiquitin-like small modifier protein SAMP2 [Halomarina pelagica]|uniref:ubiquitin-like small modifier protein SAMP2 n=1 Tax=Halomarina pelagica TaxID=2961599 RepID=UPI0020C2770D|nr:ubiquitin-like small modifier protein 2 [Halomarina sp. BND7]
MRVTVEVVGEGTHAVELDDPTESTYGDLLCEVGLNHHEASVLVDGRPVPEDAPVEAESVRVLRLIKGG